MGSGEIREAACTACDGTGVVAVPAHTTAVCEDVLDGREEQARRLTLRLEAGPNFRHGAAVGLRGKTIKIDSAPGVGRVADPVAAKVFDARIEGNELVLVLDVAPDNDTERCGDCGRTVAYSYEDEAWHHVTTPEVGCFLIPADPDA